MSARVRWFWTVVFEVGLIVVMLSSTATWPVRVAVIVVGTFLMASIHAYGVSTACRVMGRRRLGVSDERR